MTTQIPAAVIAAAQAGQKKWGVPASVTIAQWAVESGWGAHETGKFNYGGITAKVKGAVFPYKPGTPLEPATLCWTHEEVRGEMVKCQRWFKDYPGPDAFFDAHAKLLATAPVYATARAALPDVGRFVDLMAPHYATASNYADTLHSIIRGRSLTQYDHA
jgi:flagellum-specific peptidoglycan hydrolase FlgJ